MEEILWLSVATAAGSFTVTEAKLFLSFRDWLKSKNRFLGDLFCCGYCLGFWISFGLTAIYRPRVFEFWWFSDYFLTALIIAWLSAFQWVIMCWLFRKAGK